MLRLIHLCLDDTFRESMSTSPLDMDVGDDLMLGQDWISESRTTTCATSS